MIEYARSKYDSVVVVVFSRGAEKWPGHVRADWIRETVPGVEVIHMPMDFCDPWDEESWQVWVRCLKAMGPDVTHLVSSEDYGIEQARLCGWEHDMFDKERKQQHICGTALRIDAIANWSFLPDAVKRSLVKKVVMVGAESTGKSTMAKALASTYNTVWVPEFGREICEWKDISMLGVRDMEEIAREQTRRENVAALQSNGLLFCDTEIIVTRAWCHHLLGFEPSTLLGRRNDYEIYALTNQRADWIQDGTRVCEKPEVRRFFTNFILNEVVISGRPYIQLPPRINDAIDTMVNLVDTSILSACYLKKPGIIYHS